jgi:hypothetical protein
LINTVRRFRTTAGGIDRPASAAIWRKTLALGLSTGGNGDSASGSFAKLFNVFFVIILRLYGFTASRVAAFTTFRKVGNQPALRNSLIREVISEAEVPSRGRTPEKLISPKETASLSTVCSRSEPRLKPAA